MKPDWASLYYQMARARYFEEASTRLWRQGRISGELHLGIGEEAIAAGVVSHLGDGDALALDHRSTPPLVVRGVDLQSLLLELLGSQAGLCKGSGGHMHLLSPAHLAASSGIVGASGPLACGLALSADHLRPGKVAVAFFGEGAMNQGMLLESFNLAAVWKLPVIFVCKDSGFAVTTRSSTVTAGSLLDRVRSFGLPAVGVDGAEVEAVWRAAGDAVARARSGSGPAFILARCQHPEGHLLGDSLLRVIQHPVKTRHSGDSLPGALIRSPGDSRRSRLSSLLSVGRTIFHGGFAQHASWRDPLKEARRLLPGDVVRSLQQQARAEVEEAVNLALGIALEGQHG